MRRVRYSRYDYCSANVSGVERAVVLSALAPAKVNLYLHILGRLDSGYHSIDSLVCFARDVGDRLTVGLAAGDDIGDIERLHISGDFADDLLRSCSGTDNSNLVMKSVDMLRAAYSVSDSVVERTYIELEKNIPLGAGLGGGSADAALAALLLNSLWDIGAEVVELQELLSPLGADVAMCFCSDMLVATGIGDRVHRLRASLPRLNMLLVNPREHSSTGEIYSALSSDDYFVGDDISAKLITSGSNGALSEGLSLEEFVDFLHETENSLQRTAVDLCPAITNVLDELSSVSGCMLSRMSGSGSTCFGIFDDVVRMYDAAKEISARHPEWWVRTCVI